MAFAISQRSSGPRCTEIAAGASSSSSEERRVVDQPLTPLTHARHPREERCQPRHDLVVQDAVGRDQAADVAELGAAIVERARRARR